MNKGEAMYNIIEEIYSQTVLSYYRKLFTIKDKDINKLSATDISILEIIYHMKNPNYSQLSDFLNMSMPNLTYRINNLIDNGYVRRIADESDKRVHSINVTDKFADLYNANINDIKVMIDNITKTLSEEELEVVGKIIRRVQEQYMEVKDE